MCLILGLPTPSSRLRQFLEIWRIASIAAVMSWVSPGSSPPGEIDVSFMDVAALAGMVFGSLLACPCDANAGGRFGGPGRLDFGLGNGRWSASSGFRR